MRTLVATSCLFSTVVVHAYYAHAWIYHHLYLAVLVMSIIVHGTRDAWVMPADKAVAHLAFFFTLSEGLRIEDPMHMWLGVFPCIVLVLWASETFYPVMARDIHAVLHVVAIIGLHCFLAVLYPSDEMLDWMDQWLL